MNFRILVVAVLISPLWLIGCAHHATHHPSATVPSSTESPPVLENLEVSHMVEGYCFAGSREDPEAIGGFGPSNNTPKILVNDSTGDPDLLSLIALPDEAVPFKSHYRGMRLLLINRTHSEIALAASDSRLDIIQEAQDKDGEWKPIEYLPLSWCGNSDHRVFLPKDHYWEFSAPRYTGKFATKIHFVLQGKGTAPLYSNEFNGSINRKQFTKKRERTSRGIMDPYY